MNAENQNNESGRILSVEAQLIAQAAQDPEFRSRLIADPKAVMAEKGLDIPEDVEIIVVQETANQYYMVLPAIQQPDTDDERELSDNELEAVAGGTVADSRNRDWTGCASGRSGCVASNGCQRASKIVNPKFCEWAS